MRLLIVVGFAIKFSAYFNTWTLLALSTSWQSHVPTLNLVTFRSSVFPYRWQHSNSPTYLRAAFCGIFTQVEFYVSRNFPKFISISFLFFFSTRRKKLKQCASKSTIKTLRQHLLRVLTSYSGPPFISYWMPNTILLLF